MIVTKTSPHSHRCHEILAKLPRRCAIANCNAKPTVAVGGVAICKRHIGQVGAAFEALAAKVLRS